MTTWELEASEWYTTFLDGLYHENRDRLLFSDEELQQVRNIFSDQSQGDIDDDIDYLQAVYDNNCEILHAVAAQAAVLKKHLGSDVEGDILGSMGKLSHSPQFISRSAMSSDAEDDMDEDNDDDDDNNDDNDDDNDGKHHIDG
ncbi:hypothetical protein BDR04DRAFT_1122122 [Suillus decipiens]|nr:hypothetical protein BDR04DRAFT_1122122 [Suillus decipiens]